ncbi:F-box protein At2g43440-like [Brachypodium distachyon]|uniref:F-box protein At2g43440-like n=1 Tax=Brachypodium distachyon TaxID=15368 RepID=UPI000D0D3814|nr:F-box protein At2g43440-like [Brachypodium distachyon]|eukprot:XP_024314536.1 F-box protein At2g43440-like [Brachypodium distachyon]
MSPKRRRCAVVLPDHLIEEILLRLPANLRSGPRIFAFGVQDIWRQHAQEPSNVLPPLTTAPRVIKLDRFRRLVASLPPTTEEEEDQGKPPGHVNASVATAQCRGLVVLRAFADGTVSSPDMYYVCNPSTGRMAALPKGRTTGFRGSRERYHSLGLGYDARNRKHKVVHICYRGPRSAGCKVYVVNGPAGSWRPVEIGGKPMGWNRIDPGANSVFAQGHVYWLAYRELYPRRQGMFLVSSLRDDKLGIISVEPLLPFGMDNQRTFLELIELGGRLCLFDPCFTHSDGPHYDIWQLNKHGSGLATWDLHYRIDLAKVPLEVMRFGASPLAETDAPDQIYSYDSVTNNIEELLD